MRQITIDWNDFLESLDFEFECDIKTNKKGFRLDRKMKEGQKSFVNQIEHLPQFNKNTPSSCDYFYCAYSEQQGKEIFCCLEFSDLIREYKDHKPSKEKNDEIKKICEGICKKINSTTRILEVLYDSNLIKLQNFPTNDLQKYFFIIWKFHESQSDSRFLSYIKDNIEFEYSNSIYKNILVIDIETFAKRYLKDSPKDPPKKA